MTGTLTFYDAAWPPAHPPIADGVCIYIGGDTPHVWSLADIASQKARYRLPIFVRSNPPGPGAAADVATAVGMLRLIGAPKGKLVAWDMRDRGGCGLHPRRVRGPERGRVQADRLRLGIDRARQRQPGRPVLGRRLDQRSPLRVAQRDHPMGVVLGYDEDLASSSLPFWDTHPSPSPIPAWQEAMMRELPTISTTLNNDDAHLPHWLIHRIQLVVNGIFHASPQLKVDGSYGPATAAAVAKIQTNAGLVADGICGPATWPILVGTQ